MTEEPGQLAHDAFYARRPQPWEDVPEQFRADWAAVEAAIYENAAQIADLIAEDYGRPAETVAAAIRAKIGGSHG